MNAGGGVSESGLYALQVKGSYAFAGHVWWDGRIDTIYTRYEIGEVS